VEIAPLTFKLVLLDMVTQVQLDLVVETLGAMDGFGFEQLFGWKHFITADVPPVSDMVPSFTEARVSLPFGARAERLENRVAPSAVDLFHTQLSDILRMCLFLGIASIIIVGVIVQLRSNVEWFVRLRIVTCCCPDGLISSRKRGIARRRRHNLIPQHFSGNPTPRTCRHIRKLDL
jgi:hypothetical protein